MSRCKQLRWRCRRGTLELDLMLLNYLENHYSQADSEQQQAFEQLLELEDTRLMAYLLGDQCSENQHWQRVIESMR